MAPSNYGISACVGRCRVTRSVGELDTLTNYGSCASKVGTRALGSEWGGIK